MTARNAAELIQARMIADNYRAMSESLERKAAELPKTMPLSARIVRHWARIAWEAARAEEINPDTPTFRPVRHV